MEMEILKTDSQNADFIKLVKLLDSDLNSRYEELQKQYDKHNKLDLINDVVVVYRDKEPVACGAFKEHDGSSVELKRIFVANAQRRQGLGRLIVNQLEEIAGSRGYKYAVLETGIKQHEAIDLYKSCGYCIIPNYGPYIGNSNSVCMRKNL